MKKPKEPKFYRFFARPFIGLPLKFFIRPKVIGYENIPKDGRCIIAGNHTNNLDSVILAAINKRVVHFLAKDSLLKGWKKPLFVGMAIIPVNRAIHDKNALNNAIIALEEERLIGVFPESTINRTKKTTILPFKIGAVKMAAETGAPIVPFVITGEYKLFSKDLCIEFLKPIKVSKKEDLTKDNEKLMKIISKKLEEKRK